MEPEDGVFTFDWLDEAIDIMASRGMEVVLCTPTHNPGGCLTSTRTP